jgi:peptidoglycan/xylan/chitin deacetylase (PgdA/CDA1 family)
MQSSRTNRIPFIWFWPKGYEACAVMTHDVETKTGRDFCDDLMDLNDAFGIKSSFQIVPEKRYTVTPAYIENIKNRGFEVNIHGLDHQGNLFESRERIRKDAAKINEYAELFGARGFRSPCLYRNADWFQELNFSYDLSVPNAGRFEAQSGGCCTLFPYFLPGGMLELPLTATEDYLLFHILGEYSTTLWKQQIDEILKNHGLIVFLVHPDYIIPDRARNIYKALLEELRGLRSSRNIWFPLPGEVDRWWRERNQMWLTFDGRDWRVDGPGSDRATVAYACLDGDRVVYELCPRSEVVR